MASEYLTYLLVFTLGLGLVIMTDTMFREITLNLQDGVAETQLENVVVEVQRSLFSAYSLGKSSNNLHLSVIVTLPNALGRVHPFSISILNTSTGYIIIGNLTGRTPLGTSVPLTISFREAYISGSFDSKQPIHYINVDSSSGEVKVGLSDSDII